MEQRWNKFAGHRTLTGFDLGVTRLHWCWSLCYGSPDVNSRVVNTGKYMPAGTCGHREFMVVYKHHMQEIYGPLPLGMPCGMR